MTAAERRAYVRIPLDTPSFLELQFSEKAFPVLLRDVSRGGLQVGFSPTCTLDATFLGKKATVQGLPGELESIVAFVSWQSPERLGLRFEKLLALTEEALNELIANC